MFKGLISILKSIFTLGRTQVVDEVNNRVNRLEQGVDVITKEAIDTKNEVTE